MVETPKRVELLDPDYVPAVAAENRARADAAIDLKTVSDDDCEMAILSRIVADAIANGYTVSVNDGEAWPVVRSRDAAKILAALRTTEADTLLFRDIEEQTVGVVVLIYGNAPWEVIADHSDKPAIDDLLAGANALALQIEEARA